MLIDHAGAALIAALPGGYGYFFVFRLIGRASCPIFAFLAAEGCFFARDIKKYFFRVAAFAFASELPFDLFYTFTTGRVSVVCFEAQNVLFTWAFAVLGVMCFKKAALHSGRKKYVLTAAAYLPALLAEFLNTDYGCLGVIMVLWFYAARRFPKPVGLLACLAVIFALYFKTPAYVLCAAPSIAVIAAYNKKRGFSAKYFFYIFYPAHLTAMFFLGVYLRETGGLL